MNERRFVALLVFFTILFCGALLYDLEKKHMEYTVTQGCK